MTLGLHPQDLIGSGEWKYKLVEIQLEKTPPWYATMEAVLQSANHMTGIQSNLILMCIIFSEYVLDNHSFALPDAPHWWW